jgi:hypothetical protein
MTEKPSNVIQFPVRSTTKPEDPHPRNSSVYVHKDSSSVLLDGEECSTHSDFAFAHTDASGEAMIFGGFQTIEEVTHAARAYAEAFHAVFQS